MQLEDKPERWETQGNGPITLRRPGPMSLLHEDDSDNVAYLSRYQKGIQRGRIQRKIEESLDIRTLDKLDQRWI